MKKLIGITFLSFILVSLSFEKPKANDPMSDSMLGNWYLVSRNNLKQFVIAEDSIGNQTMKGFDVNTPTTVYLKKIISKQTKSDTLLVEYLNVRDNEIEQVCYVVDNQYKYARLRMFSLDTDDPVLFILVSKLELESYNALKDVKEMTENDFVLFAPYFKEQIDQFQSQKQKKSRHQIYSEIKYKLVEMGYNPLFNISLLEEYFSKFSENPNTKQWYDIMMNKN